MLFSNLRKRIGARFSAGTFLRNVSVVMAGTVLGKLIGFGFTPLLSRLYTPNDFGVLGTYNALLTMGAMVVTLQYAQAIVLPRQRENAFALLVLAGLIALITSGILAATIMTLPTTALPATFRGSVWLPLLLVLGVLFTGLNQILQAWCIRIKAFRTIAMSGIYRAIAYGGIACALGLSPVGTLGLVVGAVAAGVVENVNLIATSLADLRYALSAASWRRLRQIAVEFRDFPIYSTPQNAMNAFSQGLPVLMLGHYFGGEVTGFYSFAILALRAPMNAVLGPLRQVLYQKATDVQHRGQDMFRLYMRVTCCLFMAALAPVTLIMVAAPELFQFVFGHEWYEAGQYARWLAVWMLVMFANVPSTIFARIMRQQRNLFLYECLILVVRTITLIIGGCYLTGIYTIVMFSIVGAMLNGMYILWIGWVVKQKCRIPVCQG